MKLSIKFLKNVANVNTYQYVSQWNISEGSSHTLYFQFVDKLKDDLRYLSQATLIDSVKVTFLNIDEASEIEKTAVQAFSDDKSIWRITLNSDEVPNSGAIKVAITEDGQEKKFRVEQAIVVELLDAGSC
jgi:hypothetical protein